MKKIFIFENSNSPHETSVISSVRLFHSLGFQIVLCLNNRSYSRLSELLDLTNVEVIHINRWSGLKKFIMQYNKQDYTLFNTVALRSLFIICMTSLISKNKIFYLRNINSWFQRPLGNVFKFRHKVLGWVLFLAKKWLIRDASSLVVASFNMKLYLQKKTDKPVSIIPFNMFDENNVNTINNDKFTFVVPGTIDLKRKDLSLIRDAMYLFSKNKLNKFKLVLLGRPISEEDNTFIKNWKNDVGDSLIYYDEFIHDNEFDMVLKNADVIMGVLNINFQNKYGNKEIYGLTKDTGIEAHAIAYAKPLFVNYDYQVDTCLESTTIKFKDINDCYRKMEDLINRDIKLDYEKSALNSCNYAMNNLTVLLKGNL